jgi:glycosyltransferase involved in cell wall biosynthesis
MMDDGRPWPVVSIVTPSYCQGPFLEETIRSVLLQGYPNLEYIVIDGGSPDESVSILRKYSRWITYWISEQDQGQSDAVNKGFTQATGEIFGWLNSDDLYERNALSTITSYFAHTPDCDLLYGNGWYLDEFGNKAKRCEWVKPFDRRLFLTMNSILQPATFWRWSLWKRTGELEVDYHWAMDWEWLLRATAIVNPHYLLVDLARWRVGPNIKTLTGGWSRRSEIAEISKRYGGIRQPTYIVYWLDRLVWRISGYLGNGLASRLARYILSFIPWILKATVWRGRYLSEHPMVLNEVLPR